MNTMIGHNQAPDATQDLKARADELLQAGTRVPAELDQSTVGKAADFVKQIGDALKKAEAKRKETKEPYLLAAAAVDIDFRAITAPLAALKTSVEAKIGAFQKKAAAEERARREEEARRVAEEAARAAAAAETQTDLEDAIKREAEAQKAAKAAAVKTIDISRHRGDYGSLATIKTTWEFEIENAALVPREYCAPSETLIRAAIRAGGVRAIPGIRIYQRESTIVR
jgi:hypothetical protein